MKRKMFAHDDGYFFFKYHSPTYRDEVVENGPWNFVGNPNILNKWKHGFKFFKEDTIRVPVWVLFPNIPMQYWTVKGLNHIASAIGIPIYADSVTRNMNRISFTRICIEMVPKVSYPNSINLILEDGSSTCVKVK